MIRYTALIALLLPVLAFAGLKTVDASKPVGPGKADFSVQLPEDWLYDSSSNALTASHDGPDLNFISISILPHKKAFKDAKKVSTPKSAPEDLAEDYIAELQTGPNALRELVVVSNEPAELAGKAAFRVHVKYRAAESTGGAEMEAVAFGAALDNGVMLASYRAPSIHYFGRWIANFEAAEKSITLSAPPGKR
jgi:hypothetical protein